MPPKTEVLLLGDKVISDTGGKVSVIGIFNQVNVQGLPARHVFSAFCRLTGLTPNQDTPLRLTVSSPQGREIVSGGLAIIPHATTADIPISDIPAAFDSLGTYQVKMFSGDRYLGGTDLEVVRAPAGPAAPAGTVAPAAQ